MRLLFFILTLHATSAAIATEDWELVRHAKHRGDVSTWVRPLPGNSLKAFKGQIEVPFNMLTVIAIIGDVGRFPEWVYQCDYARLMPEFDYNISYIHIAGIWPVDDRDVVVRTSISQNPETLTIYVHTLADNGLYPEQKNTVRLPALDNTFSMKPLSDGWTRVTFETFADPGGFIPAWLANMVAIRAPRDTLKGMRRLMSENKYQLSHPSELPLQFPELTSITFPNIGKLSLKE